MILRTTSLSCYGCANEQHHGNVCAPVLTVAEKDLAHFRQAQIADGRVRVHYDSDVNFVALGRQRLQKGQAQAAYGDDSEGEFQLSCHVRVRR